MRRSALILAAALVAVGASYYFIQSSKVTFVEAASGADTVGGTRMPAATGLTALGLYHQSFDPICIYGYSNSVSPAQVAVATQIMGAHDHRLWHYFWHAARNSWHQLTAEQRKFFYSLDPLWQPARLMGTPIELLPLTGAATDKYNPRLNGAGEDFFYMHHFMMTELFQALAAAKLQCIAPWTGLPLPTDAAWPVPAGSVAPPKDDASFQMMDAWRVSFTSRTYHADKTLGEMGYLVETTIHNNMHNRWSAVNSPLGVLRPAITTTSLSNGSLTPFDAPAYNWLADSYSAATNPVFWKLHGFVETVMFLWLASHEYSSAKVACNGTVDCYQWKGTWLGAVPHSNTVKLAAVAKASSRGIASEEDTSGGHHMHGSFATSFNQKVDEFVNGTEDRDRGQPGGPGDRDKAAEKRRRRKVVDDAMAVLHKHGGMDRGVINRERIKQVKDRKLSDPSEYVRWLEEEEAKNRP
jgi:hypothetical protein